MQPLGPGRSPLTSLSEGSFLGPYRSVFTAALAICCRGRKQKPTLLVHPSLGIQLPMCPVLLFHLELRKAGSAHFIEHPAGPGPISSPGTTWKCSGTWSHAWRPQQPTPGMPHSRRCRQPLWHPLGTRAAFVIAPAPCKTAEKTLCCRERILPTRP